MCDADTLADQQDQVLARLLELGLAAAEKVQTRLIAIEDDALVGELTLALSRASRNVRQTLALQMKLARQRKRQDRDETALAAKAQETQVNRRRAQVKAAVERLIWTEAEDDEAERLLDDLDDRIGEDALYEDFTAEPVEAHIARLCQELGVTVPPPLPPATERASLTASPPHLPNGLHPSVPDTSPNGGATGWRSSA